MELSDILNKEIREFLRSKKEVILVTGGSQKERHMVASYFREQISSYFVYEFGDPESFERADPYIINLDAIPQASS